MPDHKFEPGQLVLVRDAEDDYWRLQHFSRIKQHGSKYAVIGGTSWAMCIPWAPETAHLQETTQPYEPPKPPVEYEWGQKVEVSHNGEWSKGIYVHPIAETARWHSVLVGTNKIAFIETNIRPLPDDTAAH